MSTNVWSFEEYVDITTAQVYIIIRFFMHIVFFGDTLEH